ncbi:RNA-directed DNA polymerase, eukaryota, reverse transcriptase zinc-binding domain protein [Tanacetum coccineum]
MARFNSNPNGSTCVFRKNKNHQSKPIDNPFVKDVEKIATSFYVTNFPNSLDAKNLWKEFQPFGRIADAFIANKRSKQGKRFGFVKFWGVHNEVDFEKSLSNVWIGSYHVFVSVAKFQRNPKSDSLSLKKPYSQNLQPKTSHVQDEDEEEVHAKKVHSEKHKETEDALASQPPSPKSIKI